MSHPSRPWARGPVKRRRRDLRIEALQALEERLVLAPVLATSTLTAVFTPATTPTNDFLGSVSLLPADLDGTFPSPAPLTTVSQLTAASSFGGDIVRIEAGPGGDFGKGVYAISRGGGANLNAINRPGVIYRVDPATGRSSVFFDLNTVIGAIEPGATAANSSGTQTGLVNWYDLAFDPEGYFDGRPSLFVSSADASDPNKNAVYRVGPDGSFLGAFIQFPVGTDTSALAFNPTSVHVPPPEQQGFLRGLSVGGTDFGGLFFDATSFRPGQSISQASLPTGVSNALLSPQNTVGQAALGIDYGLGTIAAFTNFGTFDPATGTGNPGFSGITPSFIFTPPDTDVPIPPDLDGFVDSRTRRFMDVAFDQYGYFSQGLPIDEAGLPVPPVVFAGSIFVADLGTGVDFSVTPVADPNNPDFPDDPIQFPVQGSGSVAVELNENGQVVPVFRNGTSTGGFGAGGRIIRIDRDDPDDNGSITDFARNFNTSNIQGPQSFIESSLSISFSADGTTLYASDNEGIWQFKTVGSLANSTAGSLIGLNDLRSLGVPYEGQDSAVAVIDTGISENNGSFRGRIAPGRDVFTNGFATRDTFATVPTDGAVTDALFPQNADGHGTLIAGVIAQFVPQATIVPVNIFAPFFTASTTTDTRTLTSNVLTSNDSVYRGLKYVADNPFVNDPVRPNKTDRVIAAALGFGTIETFDSEGSAFRSHKQVVIAFKNQLQRFRKLGITPVAATGQFGAPPNAGAIPGDDDGRNNAENPDIGDLNGISLPAVLNEVISVTGSLPFPYGSSPTSLPTDPRLDFPGGAFDPVLIFNRTLEIGGTDDTLANLVTLTNGNLQVFSDRILASANRNITTDFAAPALDIPTFRRKFGLTTDQTVEGLGTIDLDSNIVYNAGGTSLSAGIVTGSFALVASALDYWADIYATGVTADAYLTQPVGARTLDFGQKTLKNLSAYSNPDGINGILAWTSVPITDANDSLSEGEPLTLFRSSEYRDYARIDIGNAIAAIEGQIAIQYLLDRGSFDVIDSNDNGLITAPELQTFVDTATTIGLPEAGAMARLLGGTARIGFEDRTFYGEQPDQPDVLQRRFNFFDFASDGQLNGMITIDQFKLLAHNLLPLPDQYVIVDRQRASANGFLLDPEADRNFKDLQHVKPNYQFVPKSVVSRFRNVSPGIFGVNRGESPLRSSPFYAAFDHKTRRNPLSDANPQAPVKTPVIPTSSSGQTSTTVAATPATPKTDDTRVAPAQSGSSGGASVTNPSSQDQHQADLIQAIRDLIPKPASSAGEPTTAADTTAMTTTEPNASDSPPPAGTSEARPLAPTEVDQAATAAATTPVVETPKSEPEGSAQVRIALPRARAQQASGRVSPGQSKSPKMSHTKVNKVFYSK